MREVEHTIAAICTQRFVEPQASPALCRKRQEAHSDVMNFAALDPVGGLIKHHPQRKRKKM